MFPSDVWTRYVLKLVRSTLLPTMSSTQAASPTSQDSKETEAQAESSVVVVRPEESETTLTPSSGSSWTELKTRAWVGDSLHRLDVIQACFHYNVPDTEKENWLQRFTTAQAQANYWWNLDSEVRDALPYQPSGYSDHGVATAFEANYRTYFRVYYLKEMFPTKATSIMLSHLPTETFIWENVKGVEPD